jgi:anti-sigma B factor antagonist
MLFDRDGGPLLTQAGNFNAAGRSCRAAGSPRAAAWPGLMTFHELDVLVNLSRPSGQLVRFARSKEQAPMPDEVLSDGFAISARPVGTHALLVAILGELDIQTAPQARAFLAQATATTPRHLILDLTGVRFLASAGIALLIAAQSGQDGINGRLHLLGVTGNHPVERPLALVGLLGRFDIALDREALLAALRPVEAPHPARQPAPPAAWKRRDQRKELS